jgi:hypothetical protein
MAKLIAKCLAMSVIITGALNLAYNIDNVNILMTVNLIVFVGTIVISIIDKKYNEKKNIELKEEKEKRINDIELIVKAIGDIDKKFEMLNNCTYEVKDGINKIIDTINETKNLQGKHSENLIGCIEKAQDINSKSIVMLSEQLVNQLIRNSDVENQSINQVLDKLQLINKDILEHKKSTSENTENIKNMTLYKIDEIISSNTMNAKYIVESMSNENGSIKEELIDAMESNIESLVDELSSNRDQIVNIGKGLKRTKDDITNTIEENINSNKEIVTQYKEIQGAMLSELNILSDKNKHITELLMNNYKVLNVLIEEYA